MLNVIMRLTYKARVHLLKYGKYMNA